MPEVDITELDARAVRATVALVNQITPADLDRPTPCGPWNLGELLAHMIAQHHGFAASAHGGAADLADWQPAPPAADPVRLDHGGLHSQLSGADRGDITARAGADYDCVI